ncbi:DUF4465 domain-containing protein [Parvicella tangerina]|uniref:Secretion system C-terminal sorting domain-containing protein n=1 Tax=Parvicella tangerina TaxID=2829795 RepID=A0A916N835_9FLAO|nr:DUF4465 domain-containing protein [Parvicella tangerina]CAG5076290.1 hypothetical protein CRYO30217_00045 [Parvicella tangerina]
MKNIYFIAALLSGVASTAQNVSFENISIPSAESFWNGSDLTGNENPTGIFSSSASEDYFQFNTVYDTTWGAAYGIWSSGWAFSNQTSDTLTGLNGQHSSYAGGAADSAQYAIGQQNSKIHRLSSYHFFESVQISNSNYAAHSMLNGDQFAKKFGGTSGDDPDWFLLTIYAHNDIDQVYDSVEVYLADYRFSNNTQDYVVKDWVNVDISSLGTADYLRFEMTSSDMGAWGMNTPSFFAIDDLTYASSANVENAKTETVRFYPNPTTNELFIDHFERFDEFQIITIDGQILRTEPISSGHIYLNNLKSGNYYIKVIGKGTSIVKSIIKL